MKGRYKEMTVKDFMTKSTGIDEYTIFSSAGEFAFCRAANKESLIDYYGDREIVSMDFCYDNYEDNCVEIEIKTLDK